MALMISVSGIRGIFGTHLTPENLVNFTAAYGTWLDGGTVVVGRDSRVTGQICEDIVCATLQSTGCNVVKAGITPTPTVAMGVLKHNAAGGIILTASHNPEEWNALKLLNHKSEFLDAEQGEQVLDLAKKGTFTYQKYNKIGSISKDDEITNYHIQKILDLPYIDAEKIKENNYKVAVDAVNGGASIALPKMLEALGVKVERIHCEPNGIFPHNPEPLPENLHDICTYVKQNNCDLGIVTDPDGDRLALVDENGKFFGEEYTQVAAFDFMLSKNLGDTATNLSSSRAANDITQKYNQTCHRAAVGEINVVKVMQKEGAVISGEGNGGVINPDLHPGRDSLVGSAMILQLLAEREISASGYRNSLPDYEMSKQKIELKNLGVDADELLNEVAEAYKNEKVNRTDGVKIDFEEGWVHFRKSNTEPIVRVYSEAKTKDEAEKLAASVISLIQ
ncbi:phosphoglucosamine mutase [Rhodohalobacter sulfatireducens]|uniref:Phosphoglucosamine mutase n=1 Tax=Rhodohalobacter sulfatireducens TaxID=2911366 RepID=A0ABS9KI60_9BACT|nr:phosphoglucosamine mutase [Rhodohalobacter sulfatireducens]MCG2590538.1 phosphoglucosamine mutase [Rhodohalobacter sulfatireducens]